MELHEYMESRGITRDSITAEQERTRDRIEAYKLAQIRRLKDLTQASVAQSMGVSQKRVSELERGELGSMRLDTLSRYAESLGGKLWQASSFPIVPVRLRAKNLQLTPSLSPTTRAAHQTNMRSGQIG